MYLKYKLKARKKKNPSNNSELWKIICYVSDIYPWFYALNAVTHEVNIYVRRPSHPEVISIVKEGFCKDVA